MVVHAHFPVGEPRVEREARAALDAGYDVDVICLGSREESQTETIGGIAVKRVPIEHVRGMAPIRLAYEYIGFAFIAAAAVLKVHRRSPIDVIYVHAPPDFLIIAALIPRLLGSDAVIDIHDLSPHMFDARFADAKFRRLIERLLRLIEVRACSFADRVVTVHTQYRDELVAHGVPREKISVVMNSPDPAVLTRAQATVAPKRPDSFTLAYHGTINHWYGVDLIVQAMSQLDRRIPNLHAWVLGEGDALAEVELLARQHHLQSRIDFSHKYLPQAEALQRIAAASCGVIPNRRSRLNRFALSSKLLEYVSLGIPVVVARLDTLAAHFGPDEVTFFEPDDVESLATAIAWIAEHPDKATEKAERALRRADDYSWPESRLRLLEVLSCGVTT